MVHLSHFYRTLIKSSGCVIFAVAVSQCAGAQSDTVEKHIPASGVKTVTLEFKSDTTITATTQVWDKDEVYVAGVSDDKTFAEYDIEVKVDKDSVNIECRESHDTPTYLMIFIPAKLTLMIKTRVARMQVREPQGTIRFWFYPTTKPAGYIRLKVPETTTIDSRGANYHRPEYINESDRPEQIMEFDRPDQPVSDDEKPLPKGAPYLTFLDAKVDITVHRSRLYNQPPLRSFSNTAQSIARRKGPLSKAQLQSEPRLKTADTAKPPDRTSTEEEAQVTLQTQLVVVNTSVADRQGRPVSNLKQSDFKIYEDDVLQQTASFSSEKSPFNLVLLVDTNSSVGRPVPKLDLIKEAALRFLDVIGPNDKVAIIAFSHDINVVSHLSTDRERQRAAVRLMQRSRPGSVFYDALGYAVSEELAGAKGERNAVVIISDGEDEDIGTGLRYQNRPFNLGKGSLLTFKQLLDGVLIADVMIYSIQLECETWGLIELAERVREIAREQMMELATASRGRYFNPCNTEDIKNVSDRVVAELQTVYTLSYTPRNQTLDQRFRAIRVVVEHENNANYVTRSRRGYYAK